MRLTTQTKVPTLRMGTAGLALTMGTCENILGNGSSGIKKQTGFDGVRIDAVKHYPSAVSEDFLYNLQHGALWANGGDEMFAVGEWVGNATDLDNWVTSVSDRSGTFDFSLRAFSSGNSLYDMIYGNGGFDMGNLPSAQQNKRYFDVGMLRIHRTVPFINNHDTYRPQLDMDGNIIGWDTGNELSPAC